MKYAIYDPITGFIKRTGYAPAEHKSLLATDGDAILEIPDDVRVSDVFHYIVNGEIVDKPIAPIDMLVALRSIRKKRGEILAASDWTQVSDNHLTTEEREAWAKYRSDLRNITNDLADPSLVKWPLPPNVLLLIRH